MLDTCCDNDLPCELGDVEKEVENVFRGDAERLAVGEAGPYEDGGTPRVLAGMGMLYNEKRARISERPVIA